jgi:hypothetical protein
MAIISGKPNSLRRISFCVTEQGAQLGTTAAFVQGMVIGTVNGSDTQTALTLEGAQTTISKHQPHLYITTQALEFGLYVMPFGFVVSLALMLWHRSWDAQ